VTEQFPSLEELVDGSADQEVSIPGFGGAPRVSANYRQGGGGGWASAQAAEPFVRWVKSGAPAHPRDVAAGLQAAQANTRRLRAMSQVMAADEDGNYALTAARINEIGLSMPFVGADTGFALGMSGLPVASTAALRAASLAVQSATPGAVTPATPDKGVATLAPKDAAEYASLNYSLSDADLANNLVTRGFDLGAVTTARWDGSQFHSLTDDELIMPLREVLAAEADVAGSDGNFLSDAFDAVKWFSRGTFATLSAPWEAYNASIRANLKDWSDGNYDTLSNLEKIAAVGAAGVGVGWDEGWDETTFAEASRELWRTGEMRAGEGWFMGGQVEATKRVRDTVWYANQIGEDPATAGRTLASLILQPGSTPYKLASGLVDATGALALDPSTYMPAGTIRAVTRAIPGAKAFQNTIQVVDWAKGKTFVELSDVDNAAAAATTLEDVAPATQFKLPSWDQAPRAADQAGQLEQWAPAWYAAGSSSEPGVLAVLRGSNKPAEAAGLRLRSRRKMDAPDPVRVKFEPTGVQGYIDTDPATGWADELKAGYSSNVIPTGVSLPDMRARMVQIDVTEAIPAGHPMNVELDKLVNQEGWRRVVRNIPVKDQTGNVIGTRRNVSLYRPDQMLPADAERVSPFVDQVDEATGEVTRTFGPAVDSMTQPLANYTDTVSADLGFGTFLATLSEVRPLRTQELFDRQPIAAVTDATMLDEVVPLDNARVMYRTDSLKGGVDTQLGAEQVRQSVYREEPLNAWPAPRDLGDFDEAKEVETLTKQVEAEIRKQRKPRLLQAIDELDEQLQMTEVGLSIASLPKKAQERAVLEGEVPVEWFINASSDPEQLGMWLNQGPLRAAMVGDTMQAKIVGGAADASPFNDLLIANGIDPAEWRRAKANGEYVKLKANTEWRTVTPYDKVVGRVVDDEGNVVNPGRVRRITKERVKGTGTKPYVTIPGIKRDPYGELEAEMYQGFDQTIDYSRRAHEAARAKVATAEPGLPLYGAELADVGVRAGKGQAAFPQFRLFGTTRALVTDPKIIDDNMDGARAVAMNFKPNRPAKVADLDDPDVAEPLRDYIGGRLNKIEEALGGELPDAVTVALRKVDENLVNPDIEKLVRAFEELNRVLPEAQGESALRSAREMEMLVDKVFLGKYDAVKWSDSTGKAVYEVVEPSKWKSQPVTRRKVADRTTQVIDNWDERQFGVRLSGTQENLYDNMIGFDVPAQRPSTVPQEQWDAWQSQRQRMLDRGWHYEPTADGREVLRKPMAGEYSREAADELNQVLKAGDATPPHKAEAGVSDAGVRRSVVPERFYKWVTSDKRIPLKEKIAATDSVEQLIKLIGWQPAVVLRALRHANTVDDVTEELLRFTATKDIQQIAVRGAGKDAVLNGVDAALLHAPGFKRQLSDIRLFHVMPGQYVNLNDADQALREAHNWMMAARVPAAERDKVLGSMVDKSTQYGRKTVYEETFKAINATLKHHLERAWTRQGKDPAEVDAIAFKLTTFLRENQEQIAAYHTKDPGVRGHVPGTALADNDAVIPGPMILGDYMDNVLALPNPREITRITGFIGRAAASGFDLTRSKALDGVIRGADGYNTFFKVTALARIAYPVRVMLEEQGRLYASGYANIYSHPIQFILHSIKGNKSHDLMGRSWRDLAADPEPNAYSNALVNSRLLLDNNDAMKFVGNYHEPVGVESPLYVKGWMFTLGKLHGDPVARRLVGGFTEDELVSMPEALAKNGTDMEKTVWWMENHATGKEYVLSLREASAKHRPEFSQSLGNVDGMARFAQELEDQVRYATAQMDPALVGVIKRGHLVKKNGDEVRMFVDPSHGRGGQVYNAGGKGDFIAELRNYTRLDTRPDKVVAPKELLSKADTKIRDRAVTAMFSFLNSRPTNYLSRSPVFRQEYWDRVAEFATVATDEAAAAIEKQLDKVQVPKPQAKAIRKALAKRDPQYAHMTKSDIDAMAKTRALDKVQELLYDTADKTHFWDAARIVAPFGSAWAEVFKTWTKLVIDNPKVLDRMAHAIYGAQQPGSSAVYEATGTPHDEHQGFFFKDATTGDESFAWPMPQQFQQFLTMGMASGDSPEVMFPAPVSGLNLIGQIQPGFGPIVTGPATQLLNQPGWQEDLLNFIAPFGGPGVDVKGGLGNAVVDSVTPAWVRKLLVSVHPITPEQKSQLASANQAAQIYLASTGKYNTGTADGTAALQADAETLARRLYFLRGISQFVLPTMGSPEQAAVTGNGELVYQTKLAAILRDYERDPAEGGYGYQQGLLRFLKDFGSSLYLMAGAKSESTGFASPTRETYDWMRNNNDLVGKYSRTWGLLVPEPGSEFYYPAYAGMTRQGSRTLVDPSLLVETANQRLGQALYQSYRDQIGESPDEAQSDQMRAYQSMLELKFPGYSRIPDLGSGTAVMILELEQASRDKKVLASPIGEALSTYFKARSAMRAQGVSNFRTGDGRDLAPQLYALGQSLAQEVPAFTMAWDRLLSYEFDAEQFEEAA